MKNNSNKVAAKNLQAGNIIDPPAGERVWLWKDGIKRQYSVTSVELGKRTAKGQFVKIKATFPSPYRNEELSTIDCQILEDKLVTVY